MYTNDFVVIGIYWTTQDFWIGIQAIEEIFSKDMPIVSRSSGPSRHVVSVKGVAVDPEKVKIVKEWPVQNWGTSLVFLGHWFTGIAKHLTW